MEECESCKNSLICQLDSVHDLIKNYRVKDMSIETVKGRVLFIFIDDYVHNTNVERLCQELKQHGCLGVIVMHHESFKTAGIESLGYEEMVKLRDSLNTIIAKKHLTKL